MRTAFVIFNLRIGKGGHSFSLNATASALSTELNSIKIIDIANKDSYVLSSTKNSHYVRLPYNNIIVLLKNIKAEIHNEIEVIHCFDDFSYILVRMAFFGKKLPVILTKCGGGNPKHYYPYTDYLVCYSRENYSNFHASSHYQNVELLPNRLIAQEAPFQTAKLEYIKEFNVNLLCISRISDYYKVKIVQSVRLLKLLVDNDIIASLTIIGTVEDSSLLIELNKLSEEYNVKFLTDDVFTKKASAYIHYFDCVIGTGRGFMEGAIANKLMFVPTTNSNYPSLVDELNIDKFAAVNFSQRGTGENNKKKLILRFMELYKEEDKRVRYDLFIKSYSNEHFLIDGIKGKYLSLYNNAIARPNRFKFINSVGGLIYFLYRIFSFKYNFKNSFFKN